MSKQKRQHVAKYSGYLVFFVGLLLLCLYFIFFIYENTLVRFVADDFCMGKYYNLEGFWGAQKWWYLNWVGRYSFIFIVNIIVIMGSSAAGIVSIFSSFMMLLSIYYISYLFISKKLHKLRKVESSALALFLSLSLFVAFTLITPDSFESLYWLSGSLTYLAPISIFTVLSAIIFKVYLAKIELNKILILSLFFIGLFLAGFSEPYSATFIFILTLILALKDKLKLDKNTIIALIFSLTGLTIGFIIMYLAPGNKIRRELFPKPTNLPGKIEDSIIEAFNFLLKLVTDNKTIVALLILIGITIGLLVYKKINNRSYYFIFLSIILISITTLSILPSLYLQSSLPPLRTYSLTAFSTCIYIFAVGFLIGNFIGERNKYRNFILYIVIFLLSILILRIAMLQFLEVKNRINIKENMAIKYDAQESKMIENKNGEFIATKITSQDETAPANWLENKDEISKYWKNECIQKYYKLKYFNFKE